MSAMWVIYFAEISDGLKGTAGGVAVALLICGVIALCFAPLLLMLLEDDYVSDEAKGFRRSAAKTLVIAWAILLPVCGLLKVVIPSQKTIYMMAAAKVGQEIVSAPETKELSAKVLKIINEKLDDQLKKESK